MDHYSIEVFLVAICASLSHSWNYDEQDHWPEPCQSAIAQSPIDLVPSSMVKINFKPILLINWDKQYRATMKNNGHSVQVELSPEPAITILGGGLPGIYKLVQFHFHWGSEHTLNGQQKALEAHFVTHNTKYRSVEEASNYRNGIAVLGVIYEDRGKDNENFHPIIDNIPKIMKVKQEVTISINPSTLLPGQYTKFYRYDGSLTTPNCNDVVVWTIFSEVGHISRTQVKQFSTITTAEGKMLTRNFRKVQPLNGRIVYEINPVS